MFLLKLFLLLLPLNVFSQVSVVHVREPVEVVINNKKITQPLKRHQTIPIGATVIYSF